MYVQAHTQISPHTEISSVERTRFLSSKCCRQYLFSGSSALSHSARLLPWTSDLKRLSSTGQSNTTTLCTTASCTLAQSDFQHACFLLQCTMHYKHLDSNGKLERCLSINGSFLSLFSKRSSRLPASPPPTYASVSP